MRGVAITALLCAATLLANRTVRAGTERFVILSNGESAGHLVAAQNAHSVDIDYFADNNGRGPKHKEHMVLAPSGVPIEWTIQGTSLMGGIVDERFTWKDGVQRWTSQADAGEVRAAAPQLYVGNDASPWALGLYARLLLKAANHTLNVLPRGTMQLEKLRSVSVGSGAARKNLNAYLLSGIQLTPEILLMDQQGQLFAQLSGEILVRQGFETQYETLKNLGETLTLERLQAIQKRTAHVYDAPIRIQNVRLFDPQSLQVGPPMSVIVFRGVITTIESMSTSTPPADEVIVDAGGGTLVAGLHDMHAHNSLWSGAFYLAAGVTTTRDMGNVNSVLLDLVKRLDAGEIPGPHIIKSGFIEGRSAYSARLGFIPETLEEGLHDVHWYADRGYVQIKIYNSMNPEWVKPLATEARNLELRTVGHVPAFTTPDRMIEDGYNEITHINQLMLGWLIQPGEDTRTPLRLTALNRAADLDLTGAPVHHTIELMKAHHVGLDTTAVIVERLMLSRAGEVAEGDAPYLDHMPIGYQRYRRRSFVKFKDEAEKTRYETAFAKVLEVMALLHREGIPLWPGTDDATGFTVHRELELYAKIGMTPAEVLRVATFDCDRYLARDQNYGSLERGKRADFFLIPGDPSKNISAIRDIRLVMKDGVIYYPQEIYQAIGIKPFASPPLLTAPREKTPSAKSAGNIGNWNNRSAFAAQDDDQLE
jgi:Amidohydrolase family